MKFWLGAHNAAWLERTRIPLFLSHRTLHGRKTFPRAQGEWALDSGGFSELSMYGEWRTAEADYVDAVHRYQDEIGGLRWCAPQDWMCEPWIVAKTGLTVREHQQRSIRSFVSLQERGPFVPVLQGWEQRDYWAHVEMYDQAGIDLRDYPLVGIGSVCRRNGTSEAEEIIVGLAHYGIRLHGFGFSRNGLKNVAYALTSSDSMAWSYRARRHNQPMFPTCTHRRCANCLDWALEWRHQTLNKLDCQQTALPIGAP